MLTSDLARAQVRQGVLFPRWIDPADAKLLKDAAELITRFEAHVGKTAGELDEAIADFAALRTDVLLVKGLAKLLWDRLDSSVAEVANAAGVVVTPSEIRAAVFRAAGAAWPVRPGGGGGFTAREAVIADAAVILGLPVEAVEAGMYADLGAAREVGTLERVDPAALLAGYNVALAQACLLKAREVRLSLAFSDAKKARALFRELKFRRLLFRAERIADGYRLTLDGPLSLFKQTSRYGLQLAMFLPTLTRLERWKLEAELMWARGAAKGKPVVLRLDERSPLAATGRDRGTWTSAEEEHFVKAFKALEVPWRLAAAARVIDLDGRDVLVPDYVLTHPDGREAFLELVFAWRRKSFAKKLELLAAAGPKALVIALADKGGLDDEPLPEGLNVYRFKGVISPKRVIEWAETIAVASIDGGGGAALGPKRRRNRA